MPKWWKLFFVCIFLFVYLLNSFLIIGYISDVELIRFHNILRRIVLNSVCVTSQFENRSLKKIFRLSAWASTVVPVVNTQLSHPLTKKNECLGRGVSLGVNKCDSLFNSDLAHCSSRSHGSSKNCRVLSAHIIADIR